MAIKERFCFELVFDAETFQYCIDHLNDPKFNNPARAEFIRTINYLHELINKGEA